MMLTVTQGTTFSGVAYAFVSNNASEAKEDIITEWPGAGSYTKQKVCSSAIDRANMRLTCNHPDSHRSLLRSIPEGRGLGSRHR
jgi:hypothetical protein